MKKREVRWHHSCFAYFAAPAALLHWRRALPNAVREPVPRTGSEGSPSLGLSEPRGIRMGTGPYNAETYAFRCPGRIARASVFCRAVRGTPQLDSSWNAQQRKGRQSGVPYRQTSGHHIDQFHSVCDRTCCHRLLPWQNLPGWVFWWLWITYGLAYYGSFTAWWMPYLLRPDPKRVARYRTMYAATHAFLPEHNGIRPNTLHVLFDIVTVAILIDLAVLTA